MFLSGSSLPYPTKPQWSPLSSDVLLRLLFLLLWQKYPTKATLLVLFPVAVLKIPWQKQFKGERVYLVYSFKITVHQSLKVARGRIVRGGDLRQLVTMYTQSRFELRLRCLCSALFLLFFQAIPSPWKGTAHIQGLPTSRDIIKIIAIDEPTGQPDLDHPSLRLSTLTMNPSCHRDLGRKGLFWLIVWGYSPLGMESVVTGAWGSWSHCAVSEVGRQRELRADYWCSYHVVSLFILETHPVGWCLHNQGVFRNSLIDMPRGLSWMTLDPSNLITDVNRHQRGGSVHALSCHLPMGPSTSLPTVTVRAMPGHSDPTVC